MNKRYGCSHCTKTLAFIGIKMVISVVQSIDFFSLSKVKKLVVRVVFDWWMDWIWMTCVIEKLKKTMLWLDVNKILKLLIGDKNM